MFFTCFLCSLIDWWSNWIKLIFIVILFGSIKETGLELLNGLFTACSQLYHLVKCSIINSTIDILFFFNGESILPMTRPTRINQIIQSVFINDFWVSTGVKIFFYPRKIIFMRKRIWLRVRMIFICPHEIQYVVTISIGSSIYIREKAMQGAPRCAATNWRVWLMEERGIFCFLQLGHQFFSSCFLYQNSKK